jgi:hypothetical protein
MDLLIPLCFSALLLHPFHVSQAEAEWNAESARLEVALRLHPQDAQAILDRQSKTPIDLATAPEDQLAERFAAYLSDRFCLVREVGTDEALERGSWAWVGIEREATHVWLYFELGRPEGAPDSAIRLENRLLMDIQGDQTNVVLLRSLGRVGLQFRGEQVRLELPAELWTAKSTSAPDGDRPPSAAGHHH